MKIKMKVGMSGALDGVPYPPRGVEWEVNDIAGAQLCAKGLAEPVVEEPEEKVEKAVAPEPEKRADEPVKRGPGRPRKNP